MAEKTLTVTQRQLRSMMNSTAWAFARLALDEQEKRFRRYLDTALPTLATQAKRQGASQDEDHYPENHPPEPWDVSPPRYAPENGQERHNEFGPSNDPQWD